MVPRNTAAAVLLGAHASFRRVILLAPVLLLFSSLGVPKGDRLHFTTQYQYNFSFSFSDQNRMISMDHDPVFPRFATCCCYTIHC